MSLAAIKQITELEQSLRQQKEAAQAAAKRGVAEAEQEGTALVERLRAEAEIEAAVYMKNAEEKASREAEAKRAEAEQHCAGLRETAAQKLDEAVALVMGRVVNTR